MPRKRRSFNQIKEEISYRILRQKLPEAWVIHEYGPDYGIDFVVELFDYVDDEKVIAETLGETFYIQLKASASIEYSTRRAFARSNVAKGQLNEEKSQFVDIEVAKFQIEMSELLTIQAMGPAVPVLLVLVDVSTEQTFFVCLNDYIDKVIIPEDPDYDKKESKLISIPIMNEVLPIAINLIPLRAFGKRSKMYGAFGKFTYQKKEIERIRGKANFNLPMSQSEELEMIRVFAETSLNQDIWHGHEFWEPIDWSRKDLEDVLDSIHSGIEANDHEIFKKYCDEIVWHRLGNLSNIYEELVREWFLPTLLSQFLSYPKGGELQKQEV